MKIKPEHYKVIRDSIVELGDIQRKLSEHREKLRADSRVRDIEKRLRWDALWAARLSPYLSENVYPYANDEHIDTALRAVMVELGVAA